jgi:hypothetical protein
MPCEGPILVGACLFKVVKATLWRFIEYKEGAVGPIVLLLTAGLRALKLFLEFK